MFSSFLFMSLFYGLCIYAVICDGGKKYIKAICRSFSGMQRLILLFVLMVFAMFVAYWIQQDRFIYYWDYSGYWAYSINRMNYMFNHSFKDIVLTLYQSINNDDYNMFLPTIIAFPLNVFGYTFSKYVMICCIMFLIPSFFIQSLTVSKLIKNDSVHRSNVFLIAFIMAACFVGNYYAVFRGFIDVAFLLPMSASLYLFVDYDFKKVSCSKNIAIALTLVLIWICRRYTVFFLIGYVAAMLIKAVAEINTNREHFLLRKITTNFLQIGICSLGILLIFFKRFFFRALLTNYGEMYNAYDAPLSQKLASLFAAYGYISFIIIFIVGIFCFISKRQVINYICLLVLVVSETIVFWRTQNMGVHHRMILNIPIYLLCMLILEQWGKYDIKWLKILIGKIAVIFCLVAMIINFSKAFANDISAKGCGGMFSEKYYPLQRNDIDSLLELCKKLNDLTEDTEEYIYVVASGTVLNSDILRKIYMPSTENAIPQMLITCDVDLRDGFPSDFLQAKYVVTTDPIQVHLVSGQEVISYLAENIMDEKSYIGRHFDCIDEIELDNGVIAKIYCKQSDFSNADLQQMREYYTNIYPGYESIFADRIQ